MLAGQKAVITNKWYHYMLDTCFGDKWLAEAWVELSSQRMIMTDDQCVRIQWPLHCQRKASIPHSWNAWFVLELAYWVEAADEDLTRNNAKQYKMFVLMRYHTTAHTFCEKRRELEQTESGCWEISLTKRHERTHTTQSCKIPMSTTLFQTALCCFLETVQHFFPSISRPCRFYSQQHVQITRRHNFDCHPDVGLLPSLVRLVVCLDCHVTSFAHSTLSSVSSVSVTTGRR